MILSKIFGTPLLRVVRHCDIVGRMEDLIGSSEAAAILGKSPRTIHRLVQSKRLTPAMTAPGGHVGTYLFRRADIEQLVTATAA